MLACLTGEWSGGGRPAAAAAGPPPLSQGGVKRPRQASRRQLQNTSIEYNKFFKIPTSQLGAPSSASDRTGRHHMHSALRAAEMQIYLGV